ncbi:hypothetical protein OQA88_6535 [Cercophora sp. LCS_1]
MAAKFESASKEQEIVPSPERALFGPGGIISKYMVNPLIERGSKSPLRPVYMEGVHLGQSSQMATNRDNDMGGSVESVLIDRRSSSSRPRSEKVDEAEWNKGQWIPLGTSQKEEASSGFSTHKNEPERASTATQDEQNLPARLNSTRSQIEHSEKQVEKDPSTTNSNAFGSPESRPVSQNTVILNPPRYEYEEETEEEIVTAPPKRVSIPAGGVPALSPSSGNTSLALHAQIRSLQRQLEAKTEEVKQLHRLLEGKQDTDVVLLREQLRLMERECVLWRDRAERAEKRIAAFEKASDRVRKLREGLGLSKASDTGSVPVMDGPIDNGEYLYGDGDTSEEGDKRVKDWLVARQRESSSGHTEDEDILVERIRQSFEAMERGGQASDNSGSEGGGEVEYGDQDLTPPREHPATSEGPPQLSHLPFLRSSTSDDGGRLSATVAGLWMAAEERLEQESVKYRF